MKILKRDPRALKFNPYLYFLLLFVALLQFIIYDDIMNASIAINLALAFDPFYQEQKWAERPLWQRIWLVVHICIGIGLLIAMAAAKIWF
ncbi:MAG: hypothetical protein ACFCUU_01620 [Cyclobacteriaceae bacterium]